MHKYEFCHKFLEKALPESMHAKRKEAFLRVISSLLDYDIQLTVTEIGRKLSGPSSVKHKIKAADRFIGNVQITQHQLEIRKGLAREFFSGFKELLVNVDWTGACLEGYHSLQASVVMSGRSIPIYEEMYCETEVNTQQAHFTFLQNLREVIPSDIQITIITDAGFHRDWFFTVLSFGWDVIGRIYSRYCYCLEGTEQWLSVSDIVFERTDEAKCLGKVTLGKTKQPLKGYLYTYKGKLSGKKHKKNPFPSHEKMYSNYYRQGWVIFSSLKKNPKTLVNFYRKRMQIEQNFKDVKNKELGLGLRRHQSMSPQRAMMLYFIGMVLSMLLWWVGLMVEASGKHFAYQANTIKDRRVISFIKLARLMLRHDPNGISWDHFLEVKLQLQNNYLAFVDYEEILTLV